MVRAHRAKLPPPEELAEQGEGRRDERERGPRPGFEDTVWFRMNVGRRHNADPRWLLPLLCRRGHTPRNGVGAIRIAANETAFEIPSALAGRFMKAVARTARDEDDGLMIEQMQGSPREAARDNRRHGGGPRPSGPRHKGPRRHARAG